MAGKDIKRPMDYYYYKIIIIINENTYISII